MTDTIKVTCENIGATIDAPMGTTLGDIARELNIATARPFRSEERRVGKEC